VLQSASQDVETFRKQRQAKNDQSKIWYRQSMERHMQMDYTLEQKWFVYQAQGLGIQWLPDKSGRWYRIWFETQRWSCRR
jgi:hypothetical protein